MGLAPYGRPSMMEAMRDIVRVSKDGRFALNTDYFTHHSVGLDMVWAGGSPVIGPVYSEKLIEKLGPARAPEEPIEQRHKDLAASMQAMFEEAYFAMATAMYCDVGLRRVGSWTSEADALQAQLAAAEATAAELRARSALLEQRLAAVQAHAAALEANLVATIWRGREKLHYLNPVPIHEIAQRWIGKYEQGRLRVLAELQKQLEGETDG